MRWKKQVAITLASILSVTFVMVAKAEDKFLIVANGPFEEEVVRRHLEDAFIIALDGAAINFYSSKIIPDFILGDFDSLQEGAMAQNINYFDFDAAKTYFEKLPQSQDDQLKFEECPASANPQKITFVRAACQNYTDLEKGVRFAISKGAKTIIIASALGGERTDHTFANLSILKKLHGGSTKIKIETKKEIIEFLKDETVSFSGSQGAKFGLFGYPKALASSKGLEWELNHYLLDLGHSSSACNILKDKNVTIAIQGEALMIRPNY